MHEATTRGGMVHGRQAPAHPFVAEIVSVSAAFAMLASHESLFPARKTNVSNSCAPPAPNMEIESRARHMFS